ncbi:MAG: hypothetical protein JNK33_00070 [Candidatus Doudnabacteria bacterium]|nr:hypothetical protein [Candidatus Doudnabacteria bacterium]
MSKQVKERSLAIIKSPWFIVFCISIAVLTFNIVFIGKYRPFNSDDVYWQLAVKDWKPFSGQTFYFGAKDIFVILAPFFIVLESIFTYSRKLLILESLLLVLGSFTLFYYSSLYFLKKLKINLTYTVLLPFLWLASFGYPIVSWYLNSNWRSFEMGLSFAAFALVAAVCNKDLVIKSTRSRVGLSVAILLTGAMMYSDPYFTFFTIAPILIALISLQYFKKIDNNTAALLYLAVGLSYVMNKLFSVLGTSAGIFINTNAPSVFVTFESIISNILASFHEIFHIFGADFLGKPVAASTIVPLINAILLVTIFISVFSYKKYLQTAEIKRTSIEALWSVLFVFVLGSVFLTNAFSTLADISNYRFYMLFVYAGIVLLAIAIGRYKNVNLSRILTILLTAATLANLLQTVHSVSADQGSSTVSNRSNALNIDIVAAAQAQGLKKGYANFWQANINTYMSGGQILFLPVACTESGQTLRFKWLTTSSRLEKQSEASFYFIDPSIIGPKTCTQEDITKQFGEPKRTIDVNGKTFMIFDYDISSKFL